MKIKDAFPTSWAERQAYQDREAEKKATAPTRDSRTGELVPHCTGRRHQWNPLRSPRYLICERCGEVKMRDR